MNDSVLAYEPSDEAELFQTLSDGRYIRRIFKTELRDEERQKLDDFRAWVTDSGRELPLGYADEHNYDLRYLTQSNWDMEKAYEVIIENERFLREEMLPILDNFEDIRPFIEEGLLYANGRDR